MFNPFQHIFGTHNERNNNARRGNTQNSQTRYNGAPHRNQHPQPQTHSHQRQHHNHHHNHMSGHPFVHPQHAHYFNPHGQPFHGFFGQFQHQQQMHRQQATPPTSRKALNNLPTFYYTTEREYYMKNRIGLEHELCCSICLDDYQISDKLIQLPCQHIFHSNCSEPWLVQHNTCPSCRFELPVEDINKEQERVNRMKERFTAHGLRIMEIGSHVETMVDKMLYIREIVEPGHELTQELINHFTETLDSCDGYLMNATLELDNMTDFRDERVKNQRRNQIKNIQFVQSMIDTIRENLAMPSSGFMK